MRSSTFPGLEVYMSANGHCLREYRDDDGDSGPAASRASLTTTATAATTAYVQTVPNAPFHICVRAEPPFPFVQTALYCRAYVDGNSVSTTFYKPSESAAGGWLLRRFSVESRA